MSTASYGIKKQDWFKPGTALVIAAVLMLPLWMAWVNSLSNKPHYEFFPILVIGVIFLVRQRLQTLSDVELRPGHPMVSMLMGLFSIPCLFVGYFQPSSVFAFTGTISAFSMVLHALGGWALVRRISPAFVLLAVITPPPGQLDTVLTLRLQRISVVIASRTLDMLGIFHVVNMNTLEVDGQRFLVEEACSGIQSLFSILAFATFYSIWNYRGFFRTVLLLSGAVVFDLSLNVFRICLGVIAKITGDIDLLNGTPHEILGILVFVLGLMLTLSWDIVLEEIHKSTTTSAGWFGRMFRRLFSRPGSRRGGRFSGGVEIHSPSNRDPQTVSANVGRLRPRKVFVGVLAAWAVLVLPMTAMASIRFSREKYMQITAEKKDDRVAEALASKGDERLKRLEELTQKTRATFAPPTSIGEWKLLPESVQSSQRTLSFGSKSESFMYQKGNKLIHVSIDYPFYGYHDLNICYDMGGWKVEVMPEKTTGSTAELPYNVSVITRGVDQKGLLVYTAFLPDGVWKLEPPEARYDVESRGEQGLIGNLVERASYRLTKMVKDIPSMFSNATKPEIATYYENYQLQALMIGTDTPSAEEREELQTFFRQAAPEFKSKFMEANQSVVSEDNSKES